MSDPMEALLERLPRSLRWEGEAATGRLVLLDQRQLPAQACERVCTRVEDVFDAIRTLTVRGAPAIGVAAAYGVVLGLQAAASGEVGAAQRAAEAAIARLRTARPTAVNLAWALERMREAVRAAAAQPGASGGSVVQRALGRAHALREEDERLCAAIGRHGAALLPERARVLTYCNTGALATCGIGTALGVIYHAYAAGRLERVYACETRPLLQGARLTAWELERAGVPVTLLCDNMAAALLASGAIDAVIVGADRIAASGDVANKIGTYGLALLAQAHAVPLYVAAPYSTFDPALAGGDEIPIEHRAPDEVRRVGGRLCAPADVPVFNPAFDVTPARYVRAIITERGVIEPVEPARLRAWSEAGTG